MITRVESFQKIYYDSSSNTFTVTQPNGRRYVYRSVGSFFAYASTAADGDKFKMAPRSRWLLAEIIDTQVDASGSVKVYINKVTIDYAVGEQVGGANTDGTIRDGFPERPSRIYYAGYVVQFNYCRITPATDTNSTCPTTGPTSFSIGTAYLGTQHYQLTSVLICSNASCTNAADRIRGYNLVYSSSALTKTALLQTVQTFGKAMSRSASTGVLRGSATLPDVTFEYSADQYALTQKTCPGVELHSNSVMADIDAEPPL